jgi:phage portal protein BeeE
MWPFKSKQSVAQTEQKSALPGATLFFGMGVTGSMQRNAEAYAREGYSGNVVAHTCIRKIATAAASVGLQLQKGENDDLVEKHAVPAWCTDPTGSAWKRTGVAGALPI